MFIRNLILGTTVVSLLSLVGCDRGEVTAYDVPKEAAPVQAAPGADPHAGMVMSRPSVKWGELPEGWNPGPQSGGMRLATFAIAGDGEEAAEMAIIPMGGFAGTDEQLVNMWRMQLGLSELADAEAGGQGEPLVIGGVDGKIYEMSGNAQDVATRIVVASVSKDGVNYFFKLIGHDAVVLDQKGAFLGFLEGVEFAAPESMAAHPPMTAAPAAAAGDTRWTAPETWEALPATQFLLAKYRVAGEGGADAEVTVSKLGGSAGGMLPNVNRWRGQLNLPPVDEAGLKELVQEIKAGSVDATMVEFAGTDLKSGTPARMFAVIVPLPNETWFFKMTGPGPLMDAKADEFRTFVNAARF